MADIFISYSNLDRDLAKAVAAELQTAGFSVWWDRALLGGQDFRREIQAQLLQSKYVVVIWTRNSVQSRWVIDEAEEAAQVGRLVPIVHIGIERSNIPLGLRHLHMIPASDSAELIRHLSEREKLEPIGALQAVQRNTLIR